MDEHSSGLIIRTRLLTETSLIVHWLTPEFGRIATVAKGARRAKSPFQGKLDLFFLGDLSFRRSSRSELHALREVVIRDFHAPFRQNLDYLNQACYAAALIEQTTETETPLPDFFQLLTSFLKNLPAAPAAFLSIAAFEMKLLHLLGLPPDLDRELLTAGSREILKATSQLDWPALSRIRPAPPQITEIDHFLRCFMLNHLGKVPRSRPPT
jgi:DNA repair protein RecO (recombination protein O)